MRIRETNGDQWGLMRLRYTTGDTCQQWGLIRIRETNGDQWGLIRLRETNGDS